MITYIHNEEKQLNNVTYLWFIGDCLSTDFKPVDHVYDGSKLFEKDTLKQFVYSFDKKQWEESSSGSSGGSGILNLTEDEDGYLDKTYQEIADAGFAVVHIFVNSGAKTAVTSGYYAVYMLCEYGYYPEYSQLLPYYVLFRSIGEAGSIGYFTDSADGRPHRNNNAT